MAERRTCPPSGPAWTAAELAAARRRIDDAYRGAETAEDLEWVVLGWREWWLDVEATFGGLAVDTVCMLLNAGDSP